MTQSTDTLAPAEALTATRSGLSRLLALRHNKEIERFLKFLVVGTIGAVIDFGTYSLINRLGIFDHVMVPLPFGKPLTGLGIAGAIGFTLAVTSNFLWNRFWTYPDSRSKSLGGQLLIFFGINVVGLLIRTPILENASHPLGVVAAHIVPTLSAERATWFGESGAWAIAVVIVLFWNFFVNRYWTYNDVE